MPNLPRKHLRTGQLERPAARPARVAREKELLIPLPSTCCVTLEATGLERKVEVTLQP